MADQFRRSNPLFPIGIVQDLTQLTGRQIRYYEEQGLVSPSRTESKRRLYSFNDVERLLAIKDFIDQGFNLAAIRHMLDNDGAKETEQSASAAPPSEPPKISEKELHQLLKTQLQEAGRFNKTSLIQGELSRFYR
ncbi:MerR family transcriptional regulator [Exiguobacterium sp. SH3S2]|uniref:MerR family transcriptional regulator n=1 Tax=Exiguobacterium TaxID=33986 RepID=UPI000877674E|nr:MULTISPECIES: MerR family transcriptional regulator [Exiguobacterium]TCI24561.1 MerR family transcriptional regulator [Exiguobacterium sp. SH5S4]TCI46395.1 MerR family transcriptional regulator [Exiguobacterium sp. SH3S3]TCI56305.1 MerR family transcriptional regulator [Exiguobacterium sp. SH1S21]TCI57124.1 MerR family transcriptional regulator [Exiguobacterium sp. SH5S13]TCI62037.1 MerR family transcriptional regulator [Exiguobacterium sp. SH3S2]